MADLSTFQSSLSKHSIWDQCITNNVEVPGKPNSLMVVKENELYVCENSSSTFSCIRHLNLKNYKSNCLKNDFDSNSIKNNFKRIESDRRIDYKVNQITINKNGKLMALIGNNELHVMVLPQSIYQNINTEVHHASTVSIGSDIFSSKCGISIVKAEWHPLSSTDSHLVILSSDGCLRMYDVSSELKEPEQCIYIGPQYYDEYRTFTPSYYVPGRSISGNKEEMEATSFYFGSGEDWESFTLYILMRNGDVYAICPFLPSKSIAKKSLLENLSRSIEYKWKECNPDDQFLDQQYRLQKCWISTVLQNAKKAKSNEVQEEDDDIELIINGNISRFKDIHPVIQGPCLFQPSPIEFDPDECELDNYANDIILLKTEPISIIAIAYTNGKIDVCLNVSPVEAFWTSDNEPNQEFDLPILAVYETIDINLKDTLPNPEKNSIKFMPDERYPDVCYCYHQGGVHLLSFNTWYDSLKEIKPSDNLQQKFEDILKRKIPTEIKLIINTLTFGKENPIVGLAMTTNVYLGYSLYALSSSCRFAAVELPIRIKHTPLTFKNDKKDLQEIETAFSTINISCPLPIHLSSKKVSSQLYPKFVNENTLKFLAEQIKVARNDLTELEIYRNKILKRVNLQSEEFFKQLKTLNDIDQRLSSTIKDNSENLKDRIDNIIDNQSRLMHRADILLQILFDRCQPELSESEKKWFAELKHLSSIIIKKHKPHIEQLSQQLNILKKETKNSTKATEQTMRLGTSQKNSVFEALNQESVILMNTIKSLNELQNEVENIKISSN